ncbi:alkaline phosphatase family protein [Candidatus Saccharibacteria bacterium]|nr:alkaline phosphatase family protein [Candidatus Saccharibacteria bacterium]
MRVKNDYTKCVTNLACSVRQYFELPTMHATLPALDEELQKYHPRNVVVLLFDGMGANIMERALPKNAFFRQHKKCNIYTVFPATTTAATTAIRTGLNPVEHGWLGWNMYYAPIDKTIALFYNCEKSKGKNKKIEPCQDFLDHKNYLYQGNTADDLTKVGNVSATELFPFGDHPYRNLKDMLSQIERLCSQPGRHYIYAYDEEPDHTMHKKGPDSIKAGHLITTRSKKVANLATKLHDTLLVVVADHGHMKSRHYYLKDYPEITALLARTTSLEQRATSFKVKDGKKAEFRQRFEIAFGKDFTLYDSKDVISSKLFGDGTETPLFRPALGDFLAITDTGACLTAPDDKAMPSNHAGYHDDEIIVPLIIKYCE